MPLRQEGETSLGNLKVLRGFGCETVVYSIKNFNI